MAMEHDDAAREQYLEKLKKLLDQAEDAIRKEKRVFGGGSRDECWRVLSQLNDFLDSAPKGMANDPLFTEARHVARRSSYYQPSYLDG